MLVWGVHDHNSLHWYWLLLSVLLNIFYCYTLLASQLHCCLPDSPPEISSHDQEMCVVGLNLNQGKHLNSQRKSTFILVYGWERKVKWIWFYMRCHVMWMSRHSKRLQKTKTIFERITKWGKNYIKDMSIKDFVSPTK